MIQVMKGDDVQENFVVENSVESSTQTITRFGSIFTEQFGNYSISKSIDIIGDTENTFKFKENYFCYIPCCLYTNTSEIILINKEDNDRLSFILNLYGTCDSTDLTKKVIRVKKEEETPITLNCK